MGGSEWQMVLIEKKKYPCISKHEKSVKRFWMEVKPTQP
jgi:hypothetical protein